MSDGPIAAIWALHEKTSLIMGGMWAKEREKVEELKRKLAQAEFERDLAQLAVKWLIEDKEQANASHPG